MIDPKPQEMNRQNLIDVSTALAGVEHFVFFGTLLGLVRQGDIIPHDDDVDFYVPRQQRDAVIKRLMNTDFIIDIGEFPNQTNYFLQAYRMIDGVKTFVDFYLFDIDKKKDCLLDRWNFPGTPAEPDTHLFVPRELIYPLKTQRFFDCDIPMPAKGEELCAFLYGRNWRTPLKQVNVEHTKIIDQLSEDLGKVMQKAEKHKRINKAFLLAAAALILFAITR